MNPQSNDSRNADRLWADFARTGDPRTRDAIVMSFERLAYSIANRYAHRGAELDDLCQVAKVGLVNAVDRFDPAKKYSFSSFAVPTIQGEVRRYFRDKCRVIHVPRPLQELSPRVQRAAKEIEARCGRKATTQEIASALQVSEGEVEEAFRMDEIARPLSLDGLIEHGDEDGTSMEDSLGREDEDLGRVEQRAFLEQALSTLSDAEQSLLRMRYLNQMTQRAVAERLGFTQVHVCRMEQKALTQLRSSFAAVN
jgi:RNA polymerase sigma-B factor